MSNSSSIDSTKTTLMTIEVAIRVGLLLMLDLPLLNPSRFMLCLTEHEELARHRLLTGLTIASDGGLQRV